ncbi:hypothetical protein SCP_0209400 [Sparassis crispa]|uniref:Uncharacterized protein n=1 Tax=Sparassis crispa TaxID=139825 RepID=A0A401GC40_9APHY|nr:hypothetical protein SCP_0209400 [Sparassis crispa]GBE79739.1 hypothetical protein SCP_0209400 [Sparassis crispa]
MLPRAIPFFHNFIRACRPAFTGVDKGPNISQLLTKARQDYRVAKEVVGCDLIRDGYQCVVMRKYDTATKRIVSKGINKPPEPADYTELAHIVAESRKTGIRDETQPESTASAWAALEHFGKVKVADDHLNETGPHRYRVCAVHTFYYDTEPRLPNFQTPNSAHDR